MFGLKKFSESKLFGGCHPCSRATSATLGKGSFIFVGKGKECPWALILKVYIFTAILIRMERAKLQFSHSEILVWMGRMTVAKFSCLSTSLRYVWIGWPRCEVAACKLVNSTFYWRTNNPKDISPSAWNNLSQQRIEKLFSHPFTSLCASPARPFWGRTRGPTRLSRVR